MAKKYMTGLEAAVAASKCPRNFDPEQAKRDHPELAARNPAQAILALAAKWRAGADYLARNSEIPQEVLDTFEQCADELSALAATMAETEPVAWYVEYNGGVVPRSAVIFDAPTEEQLAWAATYGHRVRYVYDAPMSRDAAPVVGEDELTQALQRAAKVLPEGYIVSVQVENGAGWVELEDYGRRIEFENADLTLAQEVAAAIDAALEDAELATRGQGNER